MKSILRSSLILALLSSLTGLSLQAQNAPAPMAGAQTFDVRNGDQQGKLMIGDTDLAFESLTDGKHSHTWKYAEIRSLERSKKQVRVRPYKGSPYDFQLPDNKVRDNIYDAISQRILAARSQGRK